MQLLPKTMQKTCPIPKGSLRLVAACVLAIGSGSVVLYCWRKRKELAIKRQVAKITEERQEYVRKQKEIMKHKAQNLDDNLRQRIVNFTAEQLMKEIAEKRLTVLQVLQAYQAESYQVDLRTNCITEFLEDAEALAASLDRKREKGPLHGLPMSVKETFSIKDMDCTAGVAYLLDKPCQQDATLVAVLKQLGVVFFARTNIVQTTCSFGNSNPVYGATSNPYNPERIPGGSTCGEAALVGGRGSLIGLGTDVIGSVRCPAAMSGHYTLKPTQRRLSSDGIKPSVPGIVGLHDCPGLMSREMKVLVTVFQALVSSNMSELDPKVIPLPFQDKVFNSKKPLTIGYYEDDGIVGPTPGMKRAVRVSKDILERMGYKLVPFTIPDIKRLHRLSMTFVGLDGGQGLNEALKYEPKLDYCMSFVPKGILHRIKEAITGKKYYTILGNKVVAKSAYELWNAIAEREDYLQLFIQTLKSQKIDAILAPGYAMPGCKPEFIQCCEETFFITMIYNVINFPAGAVPVTRETDADQQELEQYPTPGALQKKIKEATKGATGMPLGVQIISFPWQEEQVLRIMQDLDHGIKNRWLPDSPLPPILENA